jgi:hypothetical protein
VLAVGPGPGRMLPDQAKPAGTQPSGLAPALPAK